MFFAPKSEDVFYGRPLMVLEFFIIWRETSIIC